MEKEELARRIQQLRNDGQDDFADAIEALIERCQSTEAKVLRLSAEQKQDLLTWEAASKTNRDFTDRACQVIKKQQAIIEMLKNEVMLR